MYDLPIFSFQSIKKSIISFLDSQLFKGAFLVLVIVVALGSMTGRISLSDIQKKISAVVTDRGIAAKQPMFQESQTPDKYVSKIEYEQAIIDAVKKASPSVVSIIISKNLPVYEQQMVNPFGNNPDFGSGAPFDFQFPEMIQKGTQKRQVGAGSGFIVSDNGFILTNKHVVQDKEAEYTVLTNDGKKYPAKVLALDPVQDLAVVKIQDEAVDSGKLKFPAVALGDSAGIEIGQGAIAIGNALGEFRNTVSVGVISGLGRTVIASGQAGFSERLEDIIQTDAAINLGNSGGPLLNLKGEVVGINTATSEEGQSIGFALPINVAKRDINQVVANNKIVYAFLGVRYLLIDEQVKQKFKLPVDQGAYVLAGDNGEPAITKDSAAEKAGVKEKDIIEEINGENITTENSMSKIIAKYNVGDKITLKILRGKEEISIDAILGERS